MNLASTDKIQVVLGGAVAANQLEIATAWHDFETTNFGISGFGNNVINTNDTTLVDAIGSPSSGNVRVPEFMSIYCTDTSIAVVSIILNRNGTSKILKKAYLTLGDSLVWSKESGFDLQRTYQSVKSFTVHGDAGANFAMTNATLAERLAGNTSRHIFMVDLEGYTQVRLRANKMVVGTAGAIFRAKYYTSYTTTVGNFLQLGLSARVEISMAATGYADTGWMDLATGARINGCCIGFTESGGDGVADPALGATDILFR